LPNSVSKTKGRESNGESCLKQGDGGGHASLYRHRGKDRKGEKEHDAKLIRTKNERWRQPGSVKGSYSEKKKILQAVVRCGVSSPDDVPLEKGRLGLPESRLWYQINLLWGAAGWWISKRREVCTNKGQIPGFEQEDANRPGSQGGNVKIEVEKEEWKPA